MTLRPQENTHFCIRPIRLVARFLSSIVFLGFGAPSPPSPPPASCLCPNSARCTRMRVAGSPTRSSASSSIATASSTLSARKYTTSASPENAPSSRAYSFTFARPPSSSSSSPNRPKRAASSSASVSGGRPVTYTAVFFDFRSGAPDADAPPLLPVAVAEEEAAGAFLPRLEPGPR